MTEHELAALETLALAALASENGVRLAADIVRELAAEIRRLQARTTPTRATATLGG